MSEEGVERRWVELVPETAPLLADLQRLHTDRWRSKGGPGLFDDELVRFYHRIAELNSTDGSSGGVWLQILEGTDGPIGMQLGLRFGSRYAIIKSGWDPRAQPLSPGQLLHAGGISRALDTGVARYDFLRGSEEYKYRLGAVDEFVTTYLRPATPGGWALLGRDALEQRIEARRAASAPDEPATTT
jgi:CelD/BcsL family acetyltransferase involved in cellulose biosynthesis